MSNARQTGVVFSGGGGHDSFTHMSISSSGAAGSIALDCSDEEAPVLGAGLVGRAVCKEFDFGGTLTGTVSYAHRPDGEVLVYRVDYVDGDSEDLPEDEVQGILLPLPHLATTATEIATPEAASGPLTSAAYLPAPLRHNAQSSRVRPAPPPAPKKGSQHNRSAAVDVADVEMDVVANRAGSDGIVFVYSVGGPTSKRSVKKRKGDRDQNRQVADEADKGGFPHNVGRNGEDGGHTEDVRGLVGADLWKQFGHEMFHGRVGFPHTVKGSAEVVYRVVYDDGNMEDLKYRDVRQLLRNGDAVQEEANIVAAPQTPGVERPSPRKRSSSSSGTKGGARAKDVAVEAGDDTGAYVESHPEAAASKFDAFMDVLIMAYEARGMERRKSKQFDGTDADTEKQEQQGGAGGAEDADPFSAASQGLLRREVSRAYTEVASAGEALSDANVDALAMLLRLLEAQVRHGMSVDMYPLATTCSDGQKMGRWGQEFPEALAALETSLEACLVCLMIATCPDLDRRLLSDELIDSCLGLFRHHLARHIAPALDPSLATTLARGGESRGVTFQKAGGKSKGAKATGSASKGSKKSRASSGEGPPADGDGDEGSHFVDPRLEERLREVSQKLSRGLGKAYEVMGLLDLLVSRVKLEDRVLLQLCSACKSCLLLEASSPSDKRGNGTSRLQPLQHGALGMLQSVTRRYPGHRTLIVEDVFGLLLQMPTGRRQLRTFRLGHVPEALGGANGGTDGYIQNVTALVMLLVQSCVTSPPVVSNASSAAAVNPSLALSPATPRGGGGGKRQMSTQQQWVQSSGVNPARNAATYFVTRFLSRCSGKESANFQPLLSNVVDDLLASVLLPEWPSAELLLHALCRALVKDLKDQKSSGRDQQYTLMAMDVLGKVAGGLADITRRERECPMVLPEATAAAGDGRPGDEGENISCVCGRTPGGDLGAGLMLDCDRCHRWFHGPCVGITSQEECPQEWFCVDCTILLQVSAQKHAHVKRRPLSATAVDLSGDFLKTQESIEDDLDLDDADTGRGGEGGSVQPGGKGEEDFEVSDLDVFRQLVLNRLTADTGGGRGRGHAASSVGSGSVSASSRSPSSGGGVAGRRRNGEAGWGWQARQTQLALWIEEAVKVDKKGFVMADFCIVLEERRRDGDADGGDAAAHLLGQWEPTGLSNSSWGAFTLGHDGTLRLCRRLFVERELCSRGLDAILGHLLALLRDPATSLRARAVKRLGGVVDADSSIMGREVVRQSVTSSFLDEAVSVRQAAVDLVGKYILADNATGGWVDGGEGTGVEGVDGGSGGERGLAGAVLLDTYFPALMSRLLDKGVSVRKSVVRILRGVLLWRSPHPRHTQICQSLVHRAVLVREEDTIRDLIRDTFQEIWFSEDDRDSIAAQAASSTPARVSRNGVRGGTEASADRGDVANNPNLRGVNAVAVQLMEVVYGVRDNDWLVKLLRGMIFGPGGGDRQKKDRSKKREASVRRCKAIVEELVAIQLGLDHGISAVPNGTASPLNELPKQLLACVDTLAVMCKASPSLLAPHVETLLPYLKGENGLSNAEESAICQQVSDMVYETLPLLDRPDLAQMTELAQDLVGLAYRFGSAVVHASLRCLSRLVQLVTHDSSPLLGLLQSFYSTLHCHRKDVREAARLTPQLRHHILRGLVVSGCICRFYAFGDSGNALVAGVDFPLPAAADEDAARPGNKRAAAVASEPPKRVTEKGARVEVFHMLRLYLTAAKEPEIRSKALQGLGQLLIGAPRLMLLADKYGVVGAALEPSAGDAVLAQALRCWKDILAAEEERVETGLAVDDMEATGVTTAQRVQGDQDAESSVVGGVLQMHLDAVLSHLFHRNTGVRSAAISLLGVMLRQGLVNPVDVVPQLLALGGDSAPFVRSQAFHLLTVEDSKNSEFVRTRLLDGLFMAYTFQQHVLCDWRPLLPSNDPASAGRAGCSLVGPAYTMCVRPQRPTRYSCLKQMMSLFAEGRAREVRSLVQSARQRLGVGNRTGEDAGGLGTHVPGVTSPSPSSYRSGANGLNRSGSLGSAKDALRALGPLDLRVLSFVCCTLAGLPYEVQEEPLFIVDYINRQMSLHGSQCLELLHTLLTRNGVQTPPPDSEEIEEDSDNETESNSAPASGTSSSAHTESLVEEDGLSHLRRISSVAAAFSMLLRLKRYLKAAYGLTTTKCQAYHPNESTKATEKPAQVPNPPPEGFSPFSARKGGERGAYDPAVLGAVAEKASETLKTGSPPQLTVFYLELRGLAHDDPQDFSPWGSIPASAGSHENDSEETGSAEGNRGRKRRRSDAALLSSTEPSGGLGVEAGAGGNDGRGEGGADKRRRASTGGIRKTAKGKRGSRSNIGTTNSSSSGGKKESKGNGKNINLRGEEVSEPQISATAEQAS